MLTRFTLLKNEQPALENEQPAPALREGAHLEPEDRQYFLEVRLQIEARKKDAFIKGAVRLLPTFEKAGLKLVASAWRTSSDPISVINFWSFGNDADNLLEAELDLPDVPEFNKFNRLIKNEVKNISIPIAPTEFVPTPQVPKGHKLSDDYRYLVLSTEVGSPDLPEFGARVEAYMTRFTRDVDWYLGRTFYSVTGLSGRITQLWVIRAEIDSGSVAMKLKDAPWLDRTLLRVDRTLEILRATPSDPTLDPSQE